MFLKREEDGRFEMEDIGFSYTKWFLENYYGTLENFACLKN
jgi:hypothetical protein